MKKLITALFTMLLIATSMSAQSSWCTKVCTAPGMPPYGMIGGGYLTVFSNDTVQGSTVNTGDIITIKWTDLNNGLCFDYKNPAIKDYHVAVYQDGKLFYDNHSYKHGQYTIGGLFEMGLGGDLWWDQFHAPFGHNYTINVCATSAIDNTENCAPSFVVSAPPVAPQVPAGTNMAGGKKKVTGKK